jgi:transcriptional regulator with PAS, ATPase and Fis domain
MILNGDFREDLFYRLNTATLEIPSLRDRKDDIIPLAQHFIKYFSEKYKMKIKETDAGAKAKLLKYHWPGNIRELKHSIEKAVILSEKEKLEADDFTFPFAGNDIIRSTQPLTLDELEKNAVREALDRNRGNLTDTASELGISRPTLYRKMQKYGL